MVWASVGGNLADLAADSRQVPVGVPANLPPTVASLTRPPRATLRVIMAVPGTLNWLKQSFTLGCTPIIAFTMSLFSRLGSEAEAAGAGLLRGASSSEGRAAFVGFEPRAPSRSSSSLSRLPAGGSGLVATAAVGAGPGPDAAATSVPLAPLTALPPFLPPLLLATGAAFCSRGGSTSLAGAGGVT